MQRITIGELVVLLVEPSPTQQKIITGHLSQLGVTRVEWEQSAGAALERMRRANPDLVISAMHLPDMTGSELIENMRLSSDLGDIPFMLISSETDVRYLTPLRQAGVIAILPKPYELDQLKRALFTTVDYLEPDTEDLEDFPVGELRVLIVDDSITSRHHISRLFNRLGIVKISEAVNGKQAVELINNQYFDLVVTDYNMPEMDGKELTEYIRDQSKQASIPILMITSESDSGRLAAVQQSGVSAICDKPFDPKTIKRVLKTSVLNTN